jgi:FdhD protein
MTADPSGPTVERSVVRLGSDGSGTDHLVVEAPLEIRLGGVPIAVVMRTPGHDADLAAGFAITEAIVLGPQEIAAVRPIPGDPAGNRWEIVLAAGVEIDPERFRRNLYTSSSCGVCGKASIDAVRIAARPAAPGPVIERAVLATLPGRMRSAQEAFALSGGLHAAAAFDAGGDILAVREDVGRHNAVDKLVGVLAETRWPPHGLGLLVSGRVSFEMVQKAAVAGLAMVAGVSAASSLAVELGAELGMTVIGFLRGDEGNIYCGEDRVRR